MTHVEGTVTGRERVVAAYKGGFADRVPAYPIAGSFAGCLDGLSIEEYCTNPTKAVKAMLNYYERYQPDIMIAFNDLAKEAEAVGCHVKYSDYVVPSIDQHVLQDDKAKLASLEIPDPRRDGRLPAFLEQCEALSAARFPSALGAVLVGPWTIAMLLRNPELMCLDTIDDPPFVHELMRFSTEYAKRLGDAVLATKIGLSYTDPTASCSLVGPDTYREFIKPYHKELVEYFRAKKVGTTVHICGTTHQIHEDLVDVGFVAITIDLDQQGDPARPQTGTRCRAVEHRGDEAWRGIEHGDERAVPQSGGDTDLELAWAGVPKGETERKRQHDWKPKDPEHGFGLAVELAHARERQLEHGMLTYHGAAVP